MKNQIKNLTKITALTFILWGTSQSPNAQGSVGHVRDRGEEMAPCEGARQRPHFSQELRQALREQFESLPELQKDGLKEMARALHSLQGAEREEHRKLVRAFVEKINALPVEDQVQYVRSRSLEQLHREGLPFPPKRR